MFCGMFGFLCMFVMCRTVESSKPSRRGLYGSIALTTATIGILIGSVFVSILKVSMNNESMEEYGWRIPFLASLLIGILAWWTQRKMPGSHEFVDAMSNNELLINPLHIAIKNHWKEILFICIVNTPSSAGMYTIYIWLPNYIANELVPYYNDAFIVNSCVLFLVVITVVMGGYLSDKFGYFRVMITSCFCLILVSVPNFEIIENNNIIGPENAPWNVIVAQVIFAIVLGCFAGPMQTYMVHLIDNVAVRYCAMGIGFNINCALFGTCVVYTYKYSIVICVILHCFNCVYLFFNICLWIALILHRWYSSCCSNSLILWKRVVCWGVFNCHWYCLWNCFVLSK